MEGIAWQLQQNNVPMRDALIKDMVMGSKHPNCVEEQKSQMWDANEEG